MKKKKGSIELSISSITLMFTALIVIMTFKLNEIGHAKNFVEDGLVASNLAAATVDLRKYGTNGEIRNTNFDKSYNDFCSALKVNLKLDNTFTPKDKNSLINSNVEIDQFTIYNVLSNNDVEVTTVSSSGLKKDLISNGGGRTKTPDGVTIKSTTVYSKIKFSINGFLNKEIYKVSKEKSVDITDQN